MFFGLFPFSLSEQAALFFLVLSFLMHTGLGFIVWRYASSNIAKRLFLLLIFIQGFQMTINFVSTLTRISDEVFLWGGRIAMASAIVFVYLLFLFVYTFLQKEPKLNLRRGRIYFLHISAIVLVGLSLTPLLFPGVHYIDYGRVPQFGFGIIPHAAFTTGLTITTFFLIFWRYFHAREIDRKKWRYIAVGLFFTFLLLFTLIYLSLIVFHDLRFAPYSGILTLPFAIFASYAILKHRFLDIRIFGTELFTFFIIGISLIQLIFARTPPEFFFALTLLVLLIFFSTLLIRSMNREIRHRADEAAYDELRKLDEAKSEFITIASHQFRTPLSAIKGYLSMMLEGFYEKDPKEEKKVLKNVSVANERLISLTDSLLSVSRMRSGKIDLNRQETDVANFVETIIEEVRPRSDGKGLLLFWKPPRESLPKISIENLFLKFPLTKKKSARCSWVY